MKFPQTHDTRGRPLLLTRAVEKRIAKLLEHGMPIKQAFAQCGIDEQTYHDWEEREKQAFDGLDDGKRRRRRIRGAVSTANWRRGAPALGR